MMTLTEPETVTRHWTAAELRLLPAIERDAILILAAKQAVDLYTHNSMLTDFEAFGEEDLHGSSSNTQPR